MRCWRWINAALVIAGLTIVLATWAYDASPWSYLLGAALVILALILDGVFSYQEDERVASAHD